MTSRIALASVVLFGTLCGTAFAQGGGACASDCNADRVVTVSEIVVAVNVVFNRVGLGACPAADSDGNGSVGIGDIVKGVNAALHGCSCGETAEVLQCGGGCPDGGGCAFFFEDEECRCVSPNQPCGGTAPVCNGECPTGSFCAHFEAPFENEGLCECIPDGAEPCGGEVGTCGGFCPEGLGCGGFNYRGFFEMCTCLGEPCPPGEVFRVDGVPPNALTGRCIPVE